MDFLNRKHSGTKLESQLDSGCIIFTNSIVRHGTTLLRMFQLFPPEKSTAFGVGILQYRPSMDIWSPRQATVRQSLWYLFSRHS